MRDPRREAMCRDVLDLVGSKWSVAIVGNLDIQGPQRFGQLRRAIPGIAPKSLTQTLRRLERDGLVNRTVLAEKRPPQVEYSLTDLGWTVTTPLRMVASWAADHCDDVLEARDAFDAHQEDNEG